MATYNEFEAFSEDLAKGAHGDLSAATLKVALSNTAPNAATNTNFADITEIAAGNGYVAGGITLASVTVTRSGLQTTVDAANPELTASGGTIGPYRYLVLYNDTAASDDLIGFWDVGAEQNISNGSTQLFDINASGLFTIN